MVEDMFLSRGLYSSLDLNGQSFDCTDRQNVTLDFDQDNMHLINGTLVFSQKCLVSHEADFA
jgi:hypothetical protein